MITKEYIIDTASKLTSGQKQELDSLSARLHTLATTSEISIDGLQTITNILKELEAFREFFTIRIINSLKRGDIH